MYFHELLTEGKNINLHTHRHTHMNFSCQYTLAMLNIFTIAQILYLNIIYGKFKMDFL